MEESGDVGAGEGNAAETETEHHGDNSGQMGPISGIVTGPNGAETLGADEERAGENEGTLLGRATLLSFDTSGVVVKSISTESRRESNETCCATHDAPDRRDSRNREAL